MNDLVKRCLEDLEERLDPAEEERILAEWLAFTEGRFTGDIFTPQRGRPNPARVEWPKVGVNPALEDYDAMILQQFGAVSAVLEGAGGAMLNVRSNYGSSIAPLLFGVEPFIMAEELNTLPTSVPLNDANAVRRLVDAGIPDLQTGFGGQVLEMGQRFAEIACLYPKIGRYVVIYHPDLQGPMDICEVVWGATMFLALYEQPDLVKAFLELATQTYTAFLNEWLRTVPFRPYANVHWGLMHRGNIMLRDDSAMNLSPAMFDEFIRPYDQRLLHAFGGGAIHFCGRGDHYVASMCGMEGMHAIAMSQPDHNDMERIYRHTVDRGIMLLGLQRSEAERALAAGRDLHGNVHCSEPPRAG
jgi:hypothetical protein